MSSTTVLESASSSRQEAARERHSHRLSSSSSSSEGAEVAAAPLVELLRQSALQLVASGESEGGEGLGSSPARSIGATSESETTTLLAAGAEGLDEAVAALLPQNLVEEDAPAKGPSLLSAAVHRRLDAGALRALAELETPQADAIALRLEQAGSNVRNPSAYVHRAVNNARRRVGAPARQPATHALDQSALAALAELPPEAAQAILDELTSKGAGVRNPSAYVVKAVGNARRGADPAAFAPPQREARPAAPFPRHHPTLRTQRPKPPPVVAPGPRRLAGVVPAPTAPPASPAPQPRRADPPPWSSLDSLQLDPKAAAALGNLPASQASQILAELQRKRAAIRNPSAYVMRATANAHAGQFPPQTTQPLARRPPALPYLVQPRANLLGPHFARAPNGLPEGMPHPKRACSS